MADADPMVRQFADETPQPILDVHLEILLKVVLGSADENHDSNLGITLVTAGGIISGTTVTRKTWHLRQADRLETAGVAHVASGFRLGEEMLSERLAKDNEDRRKLHRVFINLVDVVVIHGAQKFNFDSLRVDMRQVIGWDIAQQR